MIKKIIVVLCILPMLSFAGSVKTGNPERERSTKENMTESVYKKFEKFQEMIADGKYQAAKDGLTALTARRLNGFEKAQVEQFLGWAESSLNNYSAAIKHIKNAIATNALTNRGHFSMMLQLSQMYAGQGQYDKALKALDDYYKVTDEIKDTTFYYEASLNAQLQRYSKALKALNKAIELEDKPHETWHKLRYSLYMLVKNYQKAAKEAEYLVSLKPNKKEYWDNLNQVYFTLKQDKKALAALDLTNLNGLLKSEKDILQYYKMIAYLGIPYKAAKILEKGLKDGVVKSEYKHWKTVGDLWYTANEMDKALNAFNRASKLASDGKIDLRRAFIYYDKQDWNKAISSLNSALEKGGIPEKKIGTSYLLMGMAYNELGKTNSAIQALQKALKYKNSRKNAQQMVEYLQAEQKRKAKIKEQEKMFAEQDKNEEES